MPQNALNIYSLGRVSFGNRDFLIFEAGEEVFTFCLHSGEGQSNLVVVDSLRQALLHSV